MNCHRSSREVCENHLYLAAVIGIDRTRRVEAGHPILERQARSGADLSLVTRWNFDCESGGNCPSLHWLEDDFTLDVGEQIHPGSKLASIAGKREPGPFANSFAFQLDLFHQADVARAPHSARLELERRAPRPASASARGRPISCSWRPNPYRSGATFGSATPGSARSSSRGRAFLARRFGSGDGSTNSNCRRSKRRTASMSDQSMPTSPAGVRSRKACASCPITRKRQPACGFLSRLSCNTRFEKAA